VRSRLSCGSAAAHLVDPDGLVWCPRSQRDLEAVSCLACAELRLAIRDRAGELTEIRCTPPPRQVSAPWDLLLPR
jgi:hypothetical protein